MVTITDLTHTLNSWTRRLRLQRALTWTLRGLIVGLVLALALGSVGLYQARLLRSEFLFLILLLSITTPLVFGLTAYLWRIRSLEAARRFDLLFHLEERVSTALELKRQPGPVPPELIQLQLTDAVAASRNVNPSRALPFELKLREGLFALLFAALIGLVWLRGEAWFSAAQQARAVQHAVEQQTAQIEELIKQIETHQDLTESQKEALTEPLKQAQQALQNNPSLENSVSVLTSTGEKLQALSDPQSQAMSEALKQAGNQLSKQDGSPLQSVGQELAQGNAVNAANELANLNVSEMSSSEQQQLADQLDTLAQSLQSTNPQLANQLVDLHRRGSQRLFHRGANAIGLRLQLGHRHAVLSGFGLAKTTGQNRPQDFQYVLDTLNQGCAIADQGVGPPGTRVQWRAWHGKNLPPLVQSALRSDQ